MDSIASWGGLRFGGALLRPETSERLALPGGPWLAVGASRSYGDSGLPEESATAIDMRGLGRILSFDLDAGLIRAEAGLTLDALIDVAAPHGWFPPVVPGTRHVTLGGAVANDIHGKNHHGAGTFGEHVRAFGLLRSDGSHLACSASENADLFRATIGGLGLTGVISWIELALARVSSIDFMQEAVRLDRLSDFFDLAPESERSHGYCVAWLDSLASGRSLGRGVLLRADHAPAAGPARPLPSTRLRVPFMPPIGLINRASLTAFNALYRRRALARPGLRRASCASFCFPLDAVAGWNRLYGPGGLRQHQSVIPLAVAESTVAAMLEETHRARHGSFLTVLKLFADRTPAGLLSFPKAGATLTLDFPYRGAATDALLDRLDALTIRAGGRVNPYKDAHMSAETFAASFPEAAGFRRFMDPMARSKFAARVGLADEAEAAL